MSIEDSIKSPESEELYEEFIKKVDAGFFDELIISENNQAEEYLSGLERPVTPEHLMDAAVADSVLDEISKEPEKVVSKDEQHAANLSADKFFKMWDKVKKAGTDIEKLRIMFKTDPNNFKRYIEGKLKSN